MRRTTAMIVSVALAVAGCRRECPHAPAAPCLPPDCACGEVRVRVSSYTGASYAILADGTRVYVPPEEMSALRTGDWYCGPIGIYMP